VGAGVTPWSDCKVAFDYAGDDIDDLWVFFDKPANKRKLPDGWRIQETDCCGARFVVIFRVSVVPTVEDGERVAALLKQAAAKGMA
jgi:hypothetical protein